MKTYFCIGGSKFRSFFINGLFDPRSVKVGSATYTFENNGKHVVVTTDGEFDEEVFKTLLDTKFNPVGYDSENCKEQPRDEFVFLKLEGSANSLEKFFERGGEKILVICNPLLEFISHNFNDFTECFSYAEYFKSRFDKILKFDEFPYQESEPFKNYIEEARAKLQTVEGKYNSRLIGNVDELIEAVPRRNADGSLTKESLSNTFSAFEEFGLKKFTKQSLLDVYGIEI